MGDLETHHKFLEIPCGRKLLRVLIFAIFSVIRKNNFLPKKIRKKSNYCKSLLQSIYDYAALKNRICQACLFVFVIDSQRRVILHSVRTPQYCLKTKVSFHIALNSIYKNENIIDD